MSTRKDEHDTSPQQPNDAPGAAAEGSQPFSGNHDGGQGAMGDPERETDHEPEEYDPAE